MPFYFSRFSGLLLLFFIHGLIYAILLLRKGIKNDQSHDKWLSLFLLCCSLYIAPWMLGFAGWYDGFQCLHCRNFLFYTPLQHTLLMGPAMYFYVKTLLYPNTSFTRKDWLHFIPELVYLLWNLAVFVIDRLILGRYFLMDGVADPDFSTWYILLGLISMLVYGILSFRLYLEYKQFIVQQYSFADTISFKWIQLFLVAFLLYFLSDLFFVVGGFLGADFMYTESWWHYLFFGMLIYFIAINGYAHSIQSRALMRIATVPPEPVEPVTAAVDDQFSKEILKMMESSKIYRDPELTLTTMAQQLQTNTTVLSRSINQGFNQNFNDFINSFRVEEVKNRLLNGDSHQFTIMSLAYEAGFNSKATFNRAFKKFTGKNPKEFITNT